MPGVANPAAAAFGSLFGGIGAVNPFGAGGAFGGTCTQVFINLDQLELWYSSRIPDQANFYFFCACPGVIDPKFKEGCVCAVGIVTYAFAAECAFHCKDLDGKFTGLRIPFLDFLLRCNDFFLPFMCEMVFMVFIMAFIVIFIIDGFHHCFLSCYRILECYHRVSTTSGLAESLSRAYSIVAVRL